MDIFFIDYDSWTRSITNQVFFIEMHVQSRDRKKRVQQKFVDSHTY